MILVEILEKIVIGMIMVGAIIGLAITVSYLLMAVDFVSFIMIAFAAFFLWFIGGYLYD